LLMVIDVVVVVVRLVLTSSSLDRALSLDFCQVSLRWVHPPLDQVKHVRH
jgi:multisubunit Na+/H+ antiporter MnhF subunit